MYKQQFDYCKYTIVNVLKFCLTKFLTKWHMQTVQTQIRLLLKEQSDQGLHCLPFYCLKKQLHKKQKNMEEKLWNKIFGHLSHMSYTLPCRNKSQFVLQSSISVLYTCTLQQNILIMLYEIFCIKCTTVKELSLN